MNKFSITEYTAADSATLVKLLLKLQSTYFHKNATKQIQELRKEKDIKKSYEDYIRFITKRNNRDWKILLAISSSKKPIGFIIGSIEKDNDLVKGTIGKFEDWFVEDKWRGNGVGTELYNELEKWFVRKGCQQVMSDTWDGNESSIKAHKKLGFFVSGIMFSKKLK
jgi:RimJ/RimL family protein N-acetyltransferase